MHAGEDLAQLLGVGLVDRLDGAAEFGLRVLDEVEAILAAFAIEGVAAADVFELDRGADVARFHLADFTADLAVDGEELCDALLRATVGVGEIIAHLDFARNDLEVRHLPDVRLDGGLEEEEAGRARGIGRDFDTFRGDGARHFVGTGDDVAEELQCAAHAHVLPRANAENGEHAAADEACADACAHVFLGEGALFEELLHQRVVMLGGGFDERLVELGGLVQLLGGDVEHVWFAALRLPAIHFHLQHVHHGVKRGPGLHRILDLHGFGAVVFAELMDGVVEVGLVVVQLVDDEDDGLVELFGVAELVDGAHLDAVLSVDDHQGRVGDVEGRDGASDEVVRSGAVDEIQLQPVPFDAEYSGEDGVTVVLLYREIVADRVTGFHRATALDHSTLEEHGLCQGGLTRS